MPSAAHVVFIPGVLLVGMVIGQHYGRVRRARQLETRAKRRKQ